MSLNSSTEPTQAKDKPVSFVCQQTQDPKTQEMVPTTVALTARGTVPVIRWKTKAFGDYPPQKRCEEVSPRFQTAYETDGLNYITNGTMNNQTVICTALENKGECQTLLMTLKLEDDPLRILFQLNRVFQGSQEPLDHTANTPRLYYKINIQRFIETTQTIEDIIRGAN